MFWFIEVTDTFGGEANYSWVTRHVINADTMRAAVNRFSRQSGMHWHCTDKYAEDKRYDSASGATCYFISPLDADDGTISGFSLQTDERV